MNTDETTANNGYTEPIEFEPNANGWVPTDADHIAIAKLNASAQHTERRGQAFYSVEMMDPTFKESEDIRELPILGHYFGGSCDWLVVGHDEYGIAYGYACLGRAIDAEWGAFSLEEIESINKGLLVFERDEHWAVTTVAELKQTQRWSEILHYA
ncbi:hypothetical protein [Citricoccus nitrophenolicus]|uniref:hypothetical protein n=1 Tax=Citricoccus nitrophenolicus TaxID=863575 RepID=UPI0031EF119F